MVLEGDEAYDCWQTVFEFEADKVRQLRANPKWRALISPFVTSTSFVGRQTPVVDVISKTFEVASLICALVKGARCRFKHKWLKSFPK